MSETELQKATREMQERRTAETHAKLDAALKGICDELSKRGIPHKTRKPEALHGHIPFWRQFATIGGEYLEVEIKTESGSAMARTKGKIRVVVGPYGSRQQFPERKAGFDFVAIVDSIEAQLKGSKAAREGIKEQEELKARLDEALARINEKLGQPISGVRVFVDYHLHGINIHLDGLTEERATDVLAAVRKVFAS